MLRKHLRRTSAVALPFLVLLICSVRGSYGQSFNSGSNGSDGALDLTTPGTITFDPAVLGLNPAIPNVFNFTTINVASGVVVRFTSKNLSGPIYWLAQGAVTINGTLDLSGENGAPASTVTSSRVPAAGGAGGYNGGVGGVSANSSLPAQAGNGPGGGAGGSAPNTSTNATGGNGLFTGSQYLIPLIGGSGGGGGSNAFTAPQQFFGGGGGGGGGAILIASSVSITYGGTIRAVGGVAGSGATASGGTGSGGAIRLIAPTISNNARGDGSCSLNGALYGSVQAASSQNGVIRLEAFNIDASAIGANCASPTPLTSTPFNVVHPVTAPSLLNVTSLVVGATTIPINANPFSFPDATINASGPVTVNVQAQYIPVGTVPKIIVMSETGPDQTVNCSAPLSGTLQQSTCSAPITFPTGGSRGFVKATWTQ